MATFAEIAKPVYSMFDRSNVCFYYNFSFVSCRFYILEYDLIS